MLRKVLFLTLALALIFAVAAPIGFTATNHVSDTGSALVASVDMWDSVFFKFDPECTPPTTTSC